MADEPRVINVQGVAMYGDEGPTVFIDLKTDDGQIRLTLKPEDATQIREILKAIEDTRRKNA